MKSRILIASLCSILFLTGCSFTTKEIKSISQNKTDSQEDDEQQLISKDGTTILEQNDTTKAETVPIGQQDGEKNEVALTEENEKATGSKVQNDDLQIIKNKKTSQIKDGKKGTNHIMSGNGTQLNSLPTTAFNIQSLDITASWGVVLRQNQLTEKLQDANGYTITIGDKTYELTKNKFDENVYNGQVPKNQHTKSEVEIGLINKK